MNGGPATHGYGGSIEIKSGMSKSQSSGSIVVNSEDAGYSGVSGGIELYTGHSSRGDSGHFTVDTGNSTVGSSGGIKFAVGTGHSVINDAGSIEMYAGNSVGSSGAKGGRIIMKTGYSDNGFSGSLNLLTAEGGRDHGTSGNILAESGPAQNGNTGSVLLSTGDAQNGYAGSINIGVGSSSTSSLLSDMTERRNRGSSISLNAGESKAAQSSGGNVRITGGEGTNESLFGGGRGGRVDIKGKMSMSRVTF